MVRVLILSDLHLRGKPSGRVRGVDSRANLKSAFADSARRGPYDRVVLCGDLAQDPRPETYADLRALVGEDVLLLPGNHDDPRIMASALGTPGAGRGFAEALGDWRLVGLDTHWPRRQAGRLGDAQLAWLDARLAEDPRPVALFLHHPPVKVDTIWVDPSRLADAPELARVLERRRGQVRVIVHGHTHMASEGSLAGVPVLGAPSTAFRFVQGSILPARGPAIPGYRVLELADGSFTSQVHWVGDVFSANVSRP
jgi:Icc protein